MDNKTTNVLCEFPMPLAETSMNQIHQTLWGRKIGAIFGHASKPQVFVQKPSANN